ncbi:MAG: Wzz/FepE/Etk N-terminal domain-containing protein [Candidatus Omnitrophica bacterium]|nr:Wzz/FepE/Etk N-terminal domain-containing protein [Candidatus Omnitrophota bacterium]
MDILQINKNRNPLDYIKIFFRRKWLVIIPVFISLVAGVMACFLLPPTWQSTTVILVEEEKIINPLIQNLAVSTTAAQRMQSIREIILGWNSLVELTQKLNLAKDVKNQLEFENLIFGLRRNIQVQMRQPNIILISYLGKEPRQTQLVTQTITDILVEKNMASQTKETNIAINFIKEQLDIYKRKIKESEIAQLEEELNKLLLDSTEQHPMVKELKQRIETAKKELESGEFEVKSDATGANANPAREALKKELDKIIERETAAFSGSTAFAAEAKRDPNDTIYKLLLMDKVDSAMARDIDVNKSIYNILLQKLETAKITQRLETSREGTRYTVLDPARLPLKPVKPNKAKVMFLALFLGISSGAGLAFAREFMDQSFVDIEDAKNSLHLPVLGAISRITTTEELAQEKQRKIILSVSGILIASGLIVAAALISLLKK